TVYPIEYYYRGDARITTIPLWDRSVTGPIPPFSSEKLAEEVPQIVEGYETLWLLLSYDQGYEEEVRLYFDERYDRLEHVPFSSGLNLYGYKLRYDEKPFSQVLEEVREE